MVIQILMICINILIPVQSYALKTTRVTIGEISSPKRLKNRWSNIRSSQLVDVRLVSFITIRASHCRVSIWTIHVMIPMIITSARK